ncbi:MAG: hypothetical protein M0P70_02035, partial [Desulfobulbaceae bacterium]|nr:hypothetical protein [Desulfobulbaceae bacterium]
MLRNLSLFLSIIIFLLIAVSCTGKTLAESRVPDLTGKRFDLATYQYNNLSFNQGEKSRDRWLRCVKSLQMVYHRT